MGDGQDWMIARCGLVSTLDDVREALFKEHMRGRGSYSLGNLMVVVFFGLRVNYDLAREEINALMQVTDFSEIVDKVIEAILPTEAKDRSFTDWMKASLILNGIQPDSVHRDQLPHVIDMLQRLGKTVPYRDYTDLGVYLKKFGPFYQAAAEHENAKKRLAAKENEMVSQTGV